MLHAPFLANAASSLGYAMGSLTFLALVLLVPWLIWKGLKKLPVAARVAALLLLGAAAVACYKNVSGENRSQFSVPAPASSQASATPVQSAKQREVEHLQAAAYQKYEELERDRRALNVSDKAAVEAFNHRAALYKKMVADLEQAKAQAR